MKLVVVVSTEVTNGQDTKVDEQTVRRLLDDVQSGAKSADTAVAELRALPFVELGSAVVDHHRELRQRMGEAVYGPGKTAEQCVAVVTELLARGSGPVVLSRASAAQIDAVTGACPDASVSDATVTWRHATARPESIVVITAGTADTPVANECAAILIAHGITPQRVTDIGVAGLHRITPHLPAIQQAHAIVVIAGMEGALASVVGGLACCPVIAVPTSTGYGAGLQGVTALLGMLASCASGLTVVGIDNGFGAACAIMRMLP